MNAALLEIGEIETRNASVALVHVGAGFVVASQSVVQWIVGVKLLDEATDCRVRLLGRVPIGGVWVRRTDEFGHVGHFA